VQQLQAHATSWGVTAAQLCLAWVLAQGDDIIALAGTKRRRWLTENIAASDIVLSAEQIATLSQLFTPDAVVGDRYHATGMTTING